MYQCVPAVLCDKADILARLGDTEQAGIAYDRAIKVLQVGIERQFLMHKKRGRAKLGLEVQQGGEAMQKCNSVAYLRCFMCSCICETRLRQV